MAAAPRALLPYPFLAALRQGHIAVPARTPQHRFNSQLIQSLPRGAVAMQSNLFIVGMIAVGFQVLMLLAARQHPKQDVKGNTVLRYGWLLRAFGFATGLLLPLICVLLVPTPTVSDFVMLFAGLAFLVLVGGYYFIESMALRITVSPEGIESISPWRKPRFIRWNDIQEVVFSKANGLVIVIGSHGEKIRVSLAVIGIRDFLQEIQSRVPESRCKKAGEVLQWFPRQDAKPL